MNPSTSGHPLPGSSQPSRPGQAPQPHRICDYSDSDTDTEDSATPSGSIATPTGSPRKRGRRPQPFEDDEESYPVDRDGSLDVGKLLSPDFDVLGELVDRLDRSWPGFKKSSENRVPDPAQVVLVNQCAAPSGGLGKPPVLYELDVEKFELRPIVKKPRSEEDPEEPAAGEGGDPEPVPGTSQGTAGTESFKKPKLRNRKFIFKPFLRQEDGTLEHNEAAEPVSVVIPEQLAASYGLYIWPCSPVLAWYVWLHQQDFTGKRVLELGAGTSLPGLLCAKIGAEKVWLSDDPHIPNILTNCREAVKLNSLQDTVDVVGVSWGLYDPDIFLFESGDLDFILGSDLFFDPEVFEPLCCTLSYLLEHNPRARAYISLQERSEYWTTEEYFLKWKLRAKIIRPEEFLKGTGIEEADLTGRHTIYILDIRRLEA